MENKDNINYRDNICCIVFQEKSFLIDQLKNWPSRLWKFPQGGVDEEETDEEAIKRELYEELGIKEEEIRILSEAPGVHQYEWDEGSIKLAGNKWKGQRQRFFLIEFTGDKREIKINPDELKGYKWVGEEELRKYIFHKHEPFVGYADAVEEAISFFRKSGFLE